MIKNYPQKSSKIRVSYILPTENRAKFLREALLNIREFITKQDELIIIDGDSKDGTNKLVAQNRDLVSYFESEKSLGEAHKLNKGVLISRGKYVKALTDDDYIYPDAMKKAIQVMEENPEIDALHCGGESYIYNEKTKKLQIRFYEQVFPGFKIADDLLHVTTYCPCGLGLILTRRVISKAGLFDTSFLAVDLNYISKLILCRANFKYLNISLYKHIKYAHSGENYQEQVHSDEARVYLTHKMWEKVMAVDTKILSAVLGLNQVEKGTELLRSIKLLDFLRRKKIYFPILFLDFLSRQRKKVIKIKGIFTPKQVVLPPNYRPIPPIRDNKFW